MEMVANHPNCQDIGAVLLRSGGKKLAEEPLFTLTYHWPALECRPRHMRKELDGHV